MIIAITQCFNLTRSFFNNEKTLPFTSIRLCRGVYPPVTAWNKFPLPFPFPLSFPLPSLPVPLEVGPVIAARGLGERFSSTSGSGQSPATKRYLVNFRLKISPLVATNKYIKLMHFPLSFCKNASPCFFHGTFAPSFIWSRRPCVYDNRVMKQINYCVRTVVILRYWD